MFLRHRPILVTRSTDSRARTWARVVIGLSLGPIMLTLLSLSHSHDRSRNDTLAVGEGVKPGVARPVEAEVTWLARQIFAPPLSPALAIDQARIENLAHRLVPWEGAPLSILVHGLHLFGANLAVAGGANAQGEPRRALDVLLDARQGAVYFRGASPIVRTRYGAAVPQARTGYLGTDQGGAQAHAGQLLSVLAELGVPADAPLRYPGGEPGAVEDLVADRMANLTRLGELPWDVVALAIYAPAGRWTDKWGAVVTLDDLAIALTERDPAHSSCAGIHEGMALAVLLRTNELKPLLSPEVRTRVHQHLRQGVASLTLSQRRDGSWGYDWYQTGLSASPEFPNSPADSEAAILVTGHLLEWLALLPAADRPSQDTIRRATEWLLRAAEVQTSNPAHVRERYCPLTHAVRALAIWSGNSLTNAVASDPLAPGASSL